MRRTTTRRELLKLGATAALGAGAAHLVGACATGGGGQRHPDLCAAPAAGAAARVYAARGQDLVATTRDAIDALGGMRTVVLPGDRVFLKPNMVTLPWAHLGDVFHGGECTKAEVLVATIDACLAAGAAEVIVGDGSQQPTFDWSRARYLDGSTDLVTEGARLAGRYGKPVTFACLHADSPEFIEVPTALSYGHVAVSSLVMTADKVISIPVAKTHKWGFVTLAVKNFIGTIPLRYGWGEDLGDGQGPRVDRWRLHAADMHPAAFNRLPQDIVKAVEPDLALVDFSFGMEGDGPSSNLGGTPVDVKARLGSYLVLASTDLVAADATAARVMSQDEWKIQAVMDAARQAGLGAMCVDEIELVGATLDELRMPWRAANVAGW
jgi:uncharacterized protein (DUF362 family)